MTTALPIPEHVAIIMDGNGRWAKNRFRPRTFGHQAGRLSVDRIVSACAKSGVKTLSLYAFSTENWTRPALEVKTLMELIEKAIAEEGEKMLKHGICLKVLGNRRQLSCSLNQTIDQVEKITAHGTRMTVVLGINYSGHWAILETVRNLTQQVRDGALEPENIDENIFNAARPLPDFPPVDLLIRSSGEQRLSNFHLWELAYAELYFTDVLWPDFDETELEKAFEAYRQRERRFGSVL